MSEYGLPIREGDVRYEYIKKLWEIYFEEGFIANYEIEYFLYDITQDGIPELWVHGGNGGYSGAIVKVYTYKNKKVKCIYEGNGISEFQVNRKENYVRQFYSHSGHDIWRKFTWNGSRLVTREAHVQDYRFSELSPKDNKFIDSLANASYDDSIPGGWSQGYFGVFYDLWPILTMFDK